MLLIYIAAAVVLLVLAVSYGCYRFVFYAPNDKVPDDYELSDPRQPQEEKERCLAMIRKLNEREYERVYVTSFDGLRLTGRLYQISESAPLVIMFHGYTGTPSRDFCGGADICLSSGYNALLIEERAHCGSEGHTISFGINERRDVLSWIEFARERFGEDRKMIIVGISMGAATVLMSVSLGLPDNVRGIIADCPFAYPEKIIRYVGEARKLPIGLLFPFLKLGAKLFGGFDLSGGDAVSAVKDLRIPVMIIHGEDDDFVPCEMSEEIANANPGFAERYTFPGARHGTSYLADTERYSKLVREFYKKTLA